jgi:hypothetical protein
MRHCVLVSVPFACIYVNYGIDFVIRDIVCESRDIVCESRRDIVY